MTETFLPPSNVMAEKGHIVLHRRQPAQSSSWTVQVTGSI
jgi:hypothetical protein